jgi:hypothetical protein
MAAAPHATSGPILFLEIIAANVIQKDGATQKDGGRPHRMTTELASIVSIPIHTEKSEDAVALHTGVL